MLLMASSANAQFVLRGLLTDPATEKRLAGASVFLSNTSVGTVTNANGEFELNVPPGRYELIVSFIGYETVSRTISGNSEGLLKIEMKPKAKMLDEVVVGGYEKDGWAKFGRFFTEQFIGTSEMADGCKIKNHKAIKFRNSIKNNKLTVIANEPLVIENKSLGYTVTYQLENFEYDFTSHFLTYLGYPLFTPMQGGVAKEKRWKKNRDEVFDGSMIHFMRALYRNKLMEEGYQVRRLVKTPNKEKKRVQAIYKSGPPPADSTQYYERILAEPDEHSTFSPYTITGDSIAFAFDSVTAGVEFSNYLHIYYPSKTTSARYRAYSPRNDKAMSEIALVRPEPIEVQSNGNFSDPLNLVSLGYWSWSEKIANMLPFDYRPVIANARGNALKKR